MIAEHHKWQVGHKCPKSATIIDFNGFFSRCVSDLVDGWVNNNDSHRWGGCYKTASKMTPKKVLLTYFNNSLLA